MGSILYRLFNGYYLFLVWLSGKDHEDDEPLFVSLKAGFFLND
jgi:hypothetical protein